MDFPEWKCSDFDWNFMEVYSSWRFLWDILYVTYKIRSSGRTFWHNKKDSVTALFINSVMEFLWWVTCFNYHEVFNKGRTLVGNEIVDHSDVVGALPDGAAPTTSSFST